jgi:hypothetical protein
MNAVAVVHLALDLAHDVDAGVDPAHFTVTAWTLRRSRGKLETASSIATLESSGPSVPN